MESVENAKLALGAQNKGEWEMWSSTEETISAKGANHFGKKGFGFNRVERGERGERRACAWRTEQGAMGAENFSQWWENFFLVVGDLPRRGAGEFA